MVSTRYQKKANHSFSHVQEEVFDVVLLGLLPESVLTVLVVLHLLVGVLSLVVSLLFCLLVGKVLADLGSVILAYETAARWDILND